MDSKAVKIIYFIVKTSIGILATFVLWETLAVLSFLSKEWGLVESIGAISVLCLLLLILIDQMDRSDGQ